MGSYLLKKAFSCLESLWRIDGVLFQDFFLNGSFKKYGQSEVVQELEYENKIVFVDDLFIFLYIFVWGPFHLSVLNEDPLGVVLEMLLVASTSTLALGVCGDVGFLKGTVDSHKEVDS